MNDEHVFAFIETVYGTDFDTVHEFTFDAFVFDDIGHLRRAPKSIFGGDVTDRTATVKLVPLKSFI
jgi:hypothetical protein